MVREQFSKDLIVDTHIWAPKSGLQISTPAVDTEAAMGLDSSHSQPQVGPVFHAQELTKWPSRRLPRDLREISTHKHTWEQTHCLKT